MFYSIQALRALAAMLVVVTHAGYAYETWVKAATGNFVDVLPWGNSHIFGVSGVHLFFVISGFIIASQPVRGTGHFFISRITRVVPMYWLCTFIFFFTTGQDDVGHLVRSLSFFPDNKPTLPVGWTLNFEMFFYLLFGTIAVWLRQAWYLVIVTLVLLVTLPLDLGAAEILTHPIVLEFALGMLASRMYQNLPRIVGPALFFGGLATLFSTAIWFTPYGDGQNWDALLAWGLPSFAVVLGATAWESWSPGLLRWSPIVLLGNASYSIYLTHTLFLLGRGNLAAMLFLHMRPLRDLEPHLATAIFVAVLIAISVVAYLVIEKPLILAARSLFARRGSSALPRSAG